MFKYTLLFISALSIISLPSFGADDKDKYNLFNPTPKEKMRGLNTDRPDKTESAYSVDAGHFQFETDLITYFFNEEGTGNTQEFDLNLINLKMGITNNIDIQLIVPTYNIFYESKTNKTEQGIGDITFRTKVNIFGNDSETSALAIMPFIKFPSGSNFFTNKYFEGGVILPFAYALPLDFSLGSMLQWNYFRNDNNTNYSNKLIATLTIGHDLIENYLGAYSEIYLEKDLSDAGLVSTLDFGLTYRPLENIQFDAGINLGLNSASDKYNPFLGLSMLF